MMEVLTPTGTVLTGNDAKRFIELRRARKRAVKRALTSGGTVPFDLRQLLEDGHSAATIRKVIRPASQR